jgi:hypothetical protein
MDEIRDLKAQRRAVILAHNYQLPEIQDLADFCGDSLGLSVEASKTEAEVIVFCGVRFMAETAKILSPRKMVLLPDRWAGCPMADMITAEQLRGLKQKHPEALVVCYVNSTADVKAESDYCCTSANAVALVQSLPKDRPIIFVPDQHLGQFVENQTHRDLILWLSYCPTHADSEEDIRRREPDPDAHPECRVGEGPADTREHGAMIRFERSPRRLHRRDGGQHDPSVEGPRRRIPPRRSGDLPEHVEGDPEESRSFINLKFQVDAPEIRRRRAGFAAMVEVLPKGRRWDKKDIIWRHWRCMPGRRSIPTR